MEAPQIFAPKPVHTKRPYLRWPGDGVTTSGVTCILHICTCADGILMLPAVPAAAESWPAMRHLVPELSHPVIRDTG